MTARPHPAADHPVAEAGARPAPRPAHARRRCPPRAAGAIQQALRDHEAP